MLVMSGVGAFELSSGILWHAWELHCNISRNRVRRGKVHFQGMFLWRGVLATISVEVEVHMFLRMKL